MQTDFVHLHVHTEYSLADGLVRVKPLVQRVANAGMPAVAVTDQCNLFAMVKFYSASIAQGVKPIIGVELWVRDEADVNRPSRLVLLVQSDQGYRNLSRLVSRTYLEGQHRGVPMLRKQWLQGCSEGLIALSGGREGDVGRALLAARRADAERLVAGWRELFPERLYLELQRTSRDREDAYLGEAVELALKTNVPVVASNDVRFLSKEDFGAHEARVCIQEGRTLDDPHRPRRYSEEQYLKTPEQMSELFSDVPEALQNSVEIARRCNLGLGLGKEFPPEFPVDEGVSLNELLARESRSGLERRLNVLLDPGAGDLEQQRKVYDERLDWELKVIIEMGFPGYFLIVADFIRWAKEHGIPVGPGRGSGAGSLVAYALDITDLNPIRYDLLFERFLHTERVSMPDFDIDFCMEGRDRVIDYVTQRYGRRRVSQIITYGTMAAKAVVRDVGRVLGYPYGFVDRIAKMIPFEIGMTLDKALEENEELRALTGKEAEVRTLVDLARALEGIARNAGKHAGGVVIAPSELTDFAPLYCEQGGANVLTQFDKDDVEAVGLVKFDFLGLRTLTIIDWAVQTINRARDGQGIKPLDIAALPLDDEKTFAMLRRCLTTAVFQLESRGMTDLVGRLQLESFEDMIPLVALFRPGPLQSGMVDDFINRRQGRAQIQYPHPDLEPILKPTYGVILYQEQVMQIAQALANYTRAGADLLRQAMGKKLPAEMAKQRKVFMSGASERGVDADNARYIFDLMEKFAGYGFNKAHSTAYALVSYQTAYLKANYPAAFMAAVLSADMDNTDKVVTLIEECRRMELKILSPNVNRSGYAFTIAGENAIVYGLGAIKGVGQGAVDAIVAAREQNGPFGDLLDLCCRIDLGKVNKRVLEALIRAGALDDFDGGRATLTARLPIALQVAEQRSHSQAARQNDLFGLAARRTEIQGSDAAAADLYAEPQPEWDEDQRLAGEKETLGLYLTGHPIERYLDELGRLTCGRLADLNVPPGASAGGKGRNGRDKGSPVIIAGMVVAIRSMKSQRGGRMAFITLDDRSGRVEVAAFADVYERHRQLIAKDMLLVVKGALSTDEYSGGVRMSAEQIYDIDQAREAYARSLVIRIDGRRLRNGFAGELQQTLYRRREGGCPVCLEYCGATARARLVLAPQWKVHPTDELIQRLDRLEGSEQVRIDYGAP